MDRSNAEESLSRLDAFPYRHRVADVMSAPVATVPPDATLRDAARHMEDRSVSSVLVADGGDGAAGIVTEKDVLRAVARGAGELDRPVRSTMSAPVARVPADAPVFVALGRMQRLGVRHLAVVDAAGRVVGIVTARGLLRQRAGSALLIGDQVAAAGSPGELAEAWRGLVPMAEGLRGERVPAAEVASVTAAVLRDVTARAAELAAAEMGRAAPAPYLVLVLGSAGRGESLLVPDQDNALVFDGAAEADPWFAAMAERMTAILDAAGVPYCRGGVMASRPDWRRNVRGWRTEIERWVRLPTGANLLNVDIFFDFRPVLGAPGLGEDLRRFALDRAGGAWDFLKNLAAELDGIAPPVGIVPWLAGFRTEAGRIDLKRHGLFPVVAAARVLALRHRVAATGTAARLAALEADGHLSPADAEPMRELHALALEILLDQQLADMAAGRPPGNLVEPARLPARVRRRLRDLLRWSRYVPDIVRQGLEPG